MTSLNAKLAVSALGIITMLASPTFAQNPYHRHWSQQSAPPQRIYNMVPTMGSAPPQRIYNMVPTMGSAPPRRIYNMVPNSDDPMLTGGGSVGYNQLVKNFSQ